MVCLKGEAFGKLAKELTPKIREAQKRSSTSETKTKEASEETRIEISWDGEQTVNRISPEATTIAHRGRPVLDSAAEFQACNASLDSPETVRVRDLDTENVQLFTPVATPPALSTQSHNPEEATPLDGASTADADFVKLSEVYDCKDSDNSSEFCCESLNATEILCARRMIGQGASSQVETDRHTDGTPSYEEFRSIGVCFVVRKSS